MQFYLSLVRFLYILQYLIDFNDSIAVRGNYPWSMILCKYADRNWEPRERKWYRDWLISDQSVQHAREHKEKGDIIHENVIVVVNDGAAAVFCRDHGVLITPHFHLTSAVAHEMAHSFSIGHSFSDQQTILFPHASRGEYDDRYDLMSTANAYMFPTKFGLSGPNFAGPHLDFLAFLEGGLFEEVYYSRGWLPRYRTFYFGSDGLKRQVIRLSSLSVPYSGTNDYLLVHIPYDRDDRQAVYTVEFRTKVGNDQGSRGGVVLHQIRKKGGHYFSHIIKHERAFYELHAGQEWTAFLNKMSNNQGYQFVQVTVNSIDWEGQVAEVTITSTFDPNQCLFGEAKRNLYSGDEMCVNSLQAGAISGLLTSQDGRKNGDPCLPGFSGWKIHDATFCLDEIEQSRLRREQELANGRVNFYTRSKTYGMNECMDGLNWRMIDEFDYVCVSQSVHEDMIQQRFQPVTSPPCPDNMTLRKAFSSDNKCVLLSEHDVVRKQNTRRPFTQRYYAFFNGIDALFHKNGN